MSYFLLYSHTILDVYSITRIVSFTVSGGTFTVNVAARDAVAIHTGATGTGSGSGNTSTGSGGTTSDTVSVSFAETATTTFGEVRSNQNYTMS